MTKQEMAAQLQAVHEEAQQAHAAEKKAPRKKRKPSQAKPSAPAPKGGNSGNVQTAHELVNKSRRYTDETMAKFREEFGFDLETPPDVKGREAQNRSNIRKLFGENIELRRSVSDLQGRITALEAEAMSKYDNEEEELEELGLAIGKALACTL